ncbi:MAG: cob(I)yrinic acid a,c-diamide adenosyltransferase [Planctomycetota bacterium]
MVKLTRIYTRTGDDGRTMLGSGSRVRKEELRVEAYGTVDEANACLGAAVHACDHAQPEIAATLRGLQHDLFDVGADLCTPVTDDEEPGARLRVQAAQTKELEDLIDAHNASLSPLTSFVLPGGSGASSALHLARTVVRRAERLVSALVAAEPEQTNPETMRYLNRLSDLLFVLARVANNDGANDVLWQPGKNRGSDG